ncbi:ABC1 domain containing protein [Ophiocordyceps sinensis CO18]|uniref:Protein YAE1 n=1 Tax=Ophiocordyceps sinensis (strain Co18 / CGMCC 3.14243) TaxID=911162 RepID=T5ACJ4_OPHSC|nr:ABC1 domain containing protein [Ophiocordyceps sinensis CO18]
MHFQPVELSGEEMHPSDAADASVSRNTHLIVDASLDDVFGSASPEPQDAASHPSDMLRLQSDHTTTGYREAIAVAKASTIQAGFDEGFSLGATVGSRAGHEAAAAVGQLLAEARVELSTDRVFDAAYWAPDGNWTFDVEPASHDEILFTHVADAHPLICKWSSVTDAQIRLWKIDEAILGTADAGPRLDPLVDEAPVLAAPLTAAKKPLDW